MATIQIPVRVLDEKCAGCNCMRLTKSELYGGADLLVTEYSCENLHLCTYIRNRIVRNEPDGRKNKEE